CEPYSTTIALPLQQFIASLDKTCLPRILQVCSGVYFQGSIYELSGSEVCFSTGDLIKVTDIELVSVRCEDISNNDTFELPINHKGRVVPEKMPYSTVEEMLSLRPVGLDSCLPFAFNSHSEITLDNFTLGAGKALTVLSTEQREGEEGQVRCHFQGQQGASAEVVIPLSCRGEFYECESEECFTLQEIMSSPHLCSRRFCLNNTTMGDRSLVLSPVYQVQAIMMRKNVVKFPSSLEVDVLDVTEQCRDVTFVTPLSLTEVLSQPDESFPVMAEILESPESRSTLHCSWLPKLNRGQQLVFHRKGTTDMVLASSLKGRKAQQYFLISQEYGGRFRKRPREFSSVYELSVALALTPGLKVSVTRNIEEVVEEGLPALSVGDQLELVRCERVELACAGSKEQKQTVEALICQRIQDFNEEEDDDDEGEAEDNEKEELVLPLYMQGHFVEKLADSKKYKLKDLAKDFTLPLDVKVVSRDTELKADPLVGLSSLRLEGTVAEPTIQASFPHSPEHCFQIPTHWLSMSVCFTKDPLPWPTDQPPKIHMDKVTEVTDTFYYEFRKQGGSDETPPPRPPKRNPSTSTVPSKKVSSKSFKKAQSKTKNSKDLPDHSPHHSSADVDSDHDYEMVDETMADMVKRAQESVMFY
uniref:Thymocyte selection associated family member 2 n=1 Tax=Myripristis murdjan TaxID=586833 RepID=A0A667Z359_9TELE